MSIALMALAWKCGAPSGQKMVLLAICDNANDQGECRPSVSYLARKCSMSDRTVQRHIVEMEQAGVLRRSFRTGRSTLYYVDPAMFPTPAEFAPPYDAENEGGNGVGAHPPLGESGSMEEGGAKNGHQTPAEFAPPQNLHPSPDKNDTPPPTKTTPTPVEFVTQNHQGTIKEPSRNPKQRGKAAADGFDALLALLDGGVEGRVAKDWLAIRKAKRAPLTQTALDGVIREAGKAGLTLAAAVKKSVEKGWQGFEAAWLAPAARGQQGGGAFNPTAHINRNRPGGGQ